MDGRDAAVSTGCLLSAEKMPALPEQQARMATDGWARCCKSALDARVSLKDACFAWECPPETKGGRGQHEALKVAHLRRCMGSTSATKYQSQARSACRSPHAPHSCWAATIASSLSRARGYWMHPRNAQVAAPHPACHAALADIHRGAAATALSGSARCTHRRRIPRARPERLNGVSNAHRPQTLRLRQLGAPCQRPGAGFRLSPLRAGVLTWS